MTRPRSPVRGAPSALASWARISGRVVRLDLKTSLSSGMTALLFVVPLLAAAAVGWGLPLLLGLLSRIYAVDEALVTTVAAVFVVLTGPMMVGMVFGFVMLDERDVHLAEYYPVTPLSPASLLAIRMVVPTALQLAYGAILVPMLGLNRTGTVGLGALLVLGSALEAPLVAVVIALRAGNRLEGMTIGKALSLTSLGAIVALVLPTPQAYGALLLPQTWFLAAVFGAHGDLPIRFVDVGEPLLPMGIGIVYHLLLVWAAARSGLRRLYKTGSVR